MWQKQLEKTLIRNAMYTLWGFKKTSSNIPDVHTDPIIRKRWPSLKTYNVQ